MISRREFMQVTAATSLIYGAGTPWASVAAQQKISQDDLLDFDAYGNVTLIHMTDIHGQLMPTWYREPSINIGVGERENQPPHITGSALLEQFAITPGSAEAYALSSENFTPLARQYGRMGGLDRIATIVKSIRDSRPGKSLFLDSGDTWQGSYTSLQTRGSDMVTVMNALQPDAMTGHWEFTYGAERVRELVDGLPFPFLGANIFDSEWEEPAFEAVKTFERGGVKIAVIGQAFPYTPIANPRWMFPNWSFGIREDEIRKHVDAARAGGAGLVVLLSHNGFDVDHKLASRVDGIDVILTGHTHDALPRPIQVGNTLLIATGSTGKFVSRLDLDVQDGALRGFKYRLIPVFADVIEPDREVAGLIEKVRAPFADELGRVIGQTDSLLYRRGSLNGTIDDLFCDALLQERDAEIALSPGFRWGPSLMPDTDITVEELHNSCSMTYPAAYRSTMSGKLIKDILEDVADNLFNVDPYFQQGGDMVRVGGLGYTIDPKKLIGHRITNMQLLKTGEPIDAARDYVVAGWASVNEATTGPAIWDVVEDYMKSSGPVRIKPNDHIKVIGM